MDDGKATGVLLAYRRLANIRRIVERMRSVDWISEIIVWSNATEGETRRLRKDMPDVLVLSNGRNVYTLGRYYAASAARTTLIATCDDDCLVRDWDRLRDRCMKTGRVACYIAPMHFAHGKTYWVHRYSGGIAYETLVGWGAVFIKSAINVLERYVHDRGTSELLMRKADRFFSILQGTQHETIVQEPKHLPGAFGDEALFRRNDHWRLNKMAVNEAIDYLEQQRYRQADRLEQASGL